MDAIEYIIEARRMCHEHVCSTCPLNLPIDDTRRCIEGEPAYAQTAVNIVKDWSEAHPFHVITTNGDMIRRILTPKAKADVCVNGRHIEVVEDEAVVLAIKQSWWDAEYEGGEQ